MERERRYGRFNYKNMILFLIFLTLFYTLYEFSCIKTCSEKSMTNSYRKNDQNILEGKSHKQRVYDKIMKESRDFYKELGE